MSHLTPEALARLIDEPPTTAGGQHRGAMPGCHLTQFLEQVLGDATGVERQRTGIREHRALARSRRRGTSSAGRFSRA